MTSLRTVSIPECQTPIDDPSWLKVLSSNVQKKHVCDELRRALIHCSQLYLGRYTLLSSLISPYRYAVIYSSPDA